ncbi:threonyl-tRNA synthetase [Chloroherpeton thalassium ATCC 35110]|uniref:Threonine--tRNA ligase n=1 Tax=Chloroherpeton thalassium (strain ATCC 35110 / GB-78) TaxID=517418 RepID=SYT_CHLT3|nr:threonine--tRNA ligase [Chloroherpeton thalassium]B3QUU7.1 RecName: Full=Threonine--tRNA ligase; AltName: Full=Threonyl-tRNA synthetase; Short=ThrRS [Chloroherpeton thalassium ATCC 35110]ACF14448.1 threonyl-tRNA synthetase [Chloroherpeton thalassium ATCC 35110]
MSETLADSELIKLTLPNGDVRAYPKGVTGSEVAASIGKRLAEDALAIKFGGKLKDLAFPIQQDGAIEIVTFDSDEGKALYWHSSSHLMAQAIEELFPGTKFGAGPSIETGFYYDVASEHRFSEADLREIEARMLEISNRDLQIQREELSREAAIEYFKTRREDPFKVEILEDTLKDTPVVSIYHQGEFSDLCSGPHFSSTSKLKAVRLTSISGSFWRGDASRQQMQRIYGVSFPSEKLLKKHFSQIEEAKKRDHRKLGSELELFMISPEVGSGLPMWLPKGAILRNELESFLKDEQRRRGYLPVVTPHIGNIELYKTSGHYPYYSDSQFPPLTFTDELGKEEQYLLKPMNCPHHHQIYSSKPRSYRDLPIRLTEFGTVYRYEQSGELNGLIRVRGFTQDDSHIYCRQDQLVDEICKAIDLTQFVFKTLGFAEVQTRLSLRDPENTSKYSGNNEVWVQAEQDLKDAADKMQLNYFIGLGEASFYGPKIDFIVRDAIGRKWQLGTVQVDYVMPERFDLTYVGSDGQKHRPVVIHRAPFGSLERFIGILIENFAGNFPVWLSPVQVMVLPITDDFRDYAHSVLQKLLDAGIRAEIDERGEKVGKKIRDAEIKKIPYMFVVGEKEMAAASVAVRRHKEGDKGTMPLQEAIRLLQTDISTKKIS